MKKHGPGYSFGRFGLEKSQIDSEESEDDVATDVVPPESIPTSSGRYVHNIGNEIKVEPRVSAHLGPSAHCPDMRECPDMGDSKRTPIGLVKILKLVPTQQNIHR